MKTQKELITEQVNLYKKELKRLSKLEPDKIENGVPVSEIKTSLNNTKLELEEFLKSL